uniref:BAR domain-containing protein n=1 Tax=Panagrellus redivivus TaxID=6233 RepID=A0A7E4VY69_PANRE
MDEKSCDVELEDGNNKSRSRRKPSRSKMSAPKTAEDGPGSAEASSKSSRKKDKMSSNRSENSSSVNSSSSRHEEKGPGGAGGTMAPPPPRGQIKRFFLKFTQKMGGIEKTEYSKQFLDTIHDVENYKMVIDDLVISLMSIAQRNARWASHPMERMEFEYDDNENPYERMSPVFGTWSSLLKEPITDLNYKQIDKMGVYHRDFHRRARRALRDMRQFLCIDFPELQEARRVLNQKRQDMDYAKYELRNAKSPEVIEMKNQVYEHSQKLFEEELQKVLRMLDAFPKQKESHLRNVQAFHTVYRYYHAQVDHATKMKL